jgi:hypothetical protein
VSHFLRAGWNLPALPWVGGWFGLPFFWVIPGRRSPVSRALRPPLPPASRVVKTRPLSVSAGAGGAVRGDGVAEGGQDDLAGDVVVRSHRQGQPGVVIEPGQDLGAGPV